MLVTNLSFPSVVVGSLLLIAVAFGSSGAMLKSKIDAAWTQTAETKTKVENLQKEREIHALRLQAIELKMSQVQESLGRIEKHLGTRE